jgi:diguanylate cyclase (GGDEF)-like protein
MALNQGNNPLGYGVFSFENKVTKFYELVRYYVSVALKGALLVENIKNQALDLEKQVEERTLKLLEMNQALLNEIKLRKEAQDQLSKAMKELKLYNSKLKTESIKDELTGLNNRRGFMKLTNEILDLELTNPTEFLLLFGDLDDLKKINDQFGHNEGDFAIKKTAEILNQTFRNTDIIARISGDEFLVVIPGASMKDETVLRKKMQDNCDLYNTSSQKPYIISLSMGFAYYDPEKPNDIEALLKEADIALYKEKLKKNSRLSNRFID